MGRREAFRIGPGARDFLLAAHAHGVAAFYVTNRVCDPNNADDPTVAVLRTHYLPFRPERLLCKTEYQRQVGAPKPVAAGNRILLLIGDDFNDFSPSLANRAAWREGSAVDAYARYWGERWFMLPNPTYGSWERVFSSVDAKRKRYGNDKEGLPLSTGAGLLVLRAESRLSSDSDPACTDLRPAPRCSRPGAGKAS